MPTPRPWRWQQKRTAWNQVGGVCPFGLTQAMPIYLDQSLQAYTEVLPAGGSVNSAVRIPVPLLAELTEGMWVDVCQDSMGTSHHKE